VRRGNQYFVESKGAIVARAVQEPRGSATSCRPDGDQSTQVRQIPTSVDSRRVEYYNARMAPKNTERQSRSNERSLTQEQYHLHPDHDQPTWIDAELRKRAEAREGEADKAEAEQPRWRLVRGGRRRPEDGRPSHEPAE
jgi:hypothetical protein